MKAWSMFAHSVRLVINNLGVALRISLVLYLVSVVSQVHSYKATHGETFLGPDGNQYPVISVGEAGMMLILGLAAVFASFWMAVSWHRFVLQSEEPTGWIPKWPGGRVLAYLWRSVLVGLAVLFVVLPVVMILSLMFPPPLTLAVTVGVGSFVFFRLSPVLPAIALDKEMKMSEAWSSTSSDGLTLLGLAGLMIFASLILQLPTIISGDPGSLVSLIYSLVVGWFATMIGISLLTTVYGHYIEHRGVD